MTENTSKFILITTGLKLLLKYTNWYTSDFVLQIGRNSALDKFIAEHIETISKENADLVRHHFNLQS